MKNKLNEKKFFYLIILLLVRLTFYQLFSSCNFLNNSFKKANQSIVINM